MRVLVVEDDPNLRALWRAVFDRAGHETDQVETEPAARDALMSRAYDLVLLDLCLGKRDSVSVAQFATYLSPACKVVIVTGTSLYTRKELFAMAPAVSAVLRKPVDIEDLIAVCEHVAGLAALPRPERLASGGAEFRS
jgi:DNA-binding NtrC family response regulator